jgi:molybdopterin converting factor small subunit
MSVSVSLPGALQPFASGRRVVPLEQPVHTVRDVLDALAECCPGVVDRVLTEQGELRPHVNVFVGVENVRFADGLVTAVRDGDTIEIVPAVSGG